MNYGFKAVISPRFADIFRGNSLKGGLLTVLISTKPTLKTSVGGNRGRSADRRSPLTSLPREVRTTARSCCLEIDDYTRWRLMEGLDDIGLTLRHVDDVDEFESAPARMEAAPGANNSVTRGFWAGS